MIINLWNNTHGLIQMVWNLSICCSLCDHGQVAWASSSSFINGYGDAHLWRTAAVKICNHAAQHRAGSQSMEVHQSFMDRCKRWGHTSKPTLANEWQHMAPSSKTAGPTSGWFPRHPIWSSYPKEQDWML